MFGRKSEKIYELLDAIELQHKALRTGDFYVWRGAKMCISEFFGTTELLTREEFDRCRKDL